jgi:hypothetical protein
MVNVPRLSQPFDVWALADGAEVELSCYNITIADGVFAFGVERAFPRDGADAPTRLENLS